MITLFCLKTGVQKQAYVSTYACPKYAYANKSRCTYVRDVRQLPNPDIPPWFGKNFQIYGVYPPERGKLLISLKQRFFENRFPNSKGRL